MVAAHLSGAFPRSEKLVEATRAAVRGKTSQAAVDGVLHSDIKGLVELQTQAQLDSIVDGQLNWQDLFRPFSELFSGIKLGGLTRWFDNNTFYRKPVIVDKIKFTGKSIERYFHKDLLPASARKKAILPGPFTFTSMSQNSGYPSFEDLVDDVAHGLRDLAVSLRRHGYEDFQFNEPALCVGRKSERELEIAKHGIEVCAKGAGGRSILQTYFGDASAIIDDLLGFPVDCVGLDFYATSPDSLNEHDFNKELVCGCIDGRNSLLESPQDLQKFVAKIKEDLEPRELSVSPNCDLEFLPRPVAENKVRLLAETKALLAEK